MAGSYRHAVTDDGRLVAPSHIGIAAENLGDAYETIEEMYGMIWYLAGQLGVSDETVVAWVEQANRHWKFGITQFSPGREEE